MSSIASTSSQVHYPDFKIYRRYKDKSEDDWDGDVFLDKTKHWKFHEAAPPYIILVQGPPNVGKSLLIKSLVKHFTGKEHMGDIQGPITIITEYKRRLQFVECTDDINAMIDAAKYADLVLLMVAANYGLEAETFEFLNLLQAHGFPKIMGVFTHLDQLQDEIALNKIKQLHDQFQTEICQPATVSYLFGLGDRELYKEYEVQRLAECISMILFISRFIPSSWKEAHPYVLVDCFEDVTPLEKVQEDANCKRNLSLYGYLRGCNIKSGAKVHIAGVGDFRLAGVKSTTDPCPLLSGMDKDNDFVELTHLKNESFRIGTYLRMEVHDVPFQMVESFDPCHPILVGGISSEEDAVGLMQARLKRHKWHMKLLESGEPVTVSAGWRRYQTKPIYAREISNGQHKILEFNPEHDHCLAMLRGPVAPPSTRIAVVQSDKEVFRIAAKAVVLDPKHDLKIMKDSEKKGKPHRILMRRTALIKFNPKYNDVAKFKGAPIRTRSGIWGEVTERKGKGFAICTFEKGIRKSDVVIMPVLCQAEVPPFDPLLATLKPCDSTTPVKKDSLKKEDPAQRQFRLEQRRGVEITDEEPSSYPYTSSFMLTGNIKYNYMSRNKLKETVVIMSEEKRAQLVEKQLREEEEKADEEFFGRREVVMYD
ncbi:hypothetical protein MKW92_007890 [Papaver armeniacum]|nr:hypothetical protein MKW92_007890 [Papaver armeniacum]